jgi:hypothetical protein
LPINPGDHAEMAILIRREKLANERIEKATGDLALWVRRGKLAKEKGKLDMARQAMDRAIEAKRILDKAQFELETLQMDKDVLKSGAQMPDDESVIRAEVLVEQFRMQGFAPEEQELKEMQADVEAEFELLALKDET